MKRNGFLCSKPMLSVITVCLNSEKTIRKTIQSVVSQKTDDIEYVIVDGGSTDNTVSIIEEYIDWIDIFLSEKDNGIYDAMNKGIHLASGDYIGFLNGDDWYENDILYKVIQSFNATNVDFVYGKMNLISGGKNVGVMKGQGFTEDIWHTMPFGHPASFVKKELFERIGLFDTKYKIAADYQWMLRAYVAGVNACELDDVITNFSQSGVSNTNKIESTIEAWGASKEIYYNNTNRVNNKGTEKIDVIFSESLQYLAATELLSGSLEVASDYFKGIINNNEQTMIWGAGKWGQMIAKALNYSEISIKCFVDNNIEMIGKEKCGIQIKDPDVINEFNGLLIIAVKGHDKDIEVQINDNFHFSGRIMLLDKIVSELSNIHRRIEHVKYETAYY